jgi:co-chaperonin GroES (HSP10)
MIDKIVPLPGYCLIQPQDDTQEVKGSAGTFKYADTVEDQESQKIGKVLAIGEETTNDYGTFLESPKDVEIGSIVVHAQYGVDKFRYNNQDLRFVRFQDLRGIIK